MSEQDKAKRAAKAVLDELNGRSGYDSLWDQLPSWLKREIRDALAERIRKVYQ